MTQDLPSSGGLGHASHGSHCEVSVSGIHCLLPIVTLELARSEAVRPTNCLTFRECRRLSVRPTFLSHTCRLRVAVRIDYASRSTRCLSCLRAPITPSPIIYASDSPGVWDPPRLGSGRQPGTQPAIQIVWTQHTTVQTGSPRYERS